MCVGSGKKELKGRKAAWQSGATLAVPAAPPVWKELWGLSENWLIDTHEPRSY